MDERKSFVLGRIDLRAQIDRLGPGIAFPVDEVDIHPTIPARHIGREEEPVVVRAQGRVHAGERIAVEGQFGHFFPVVCPADSLVYFEDYLARLIRFTDPLLQVVTGKKQGVFRAVETYRAFVQGRIDLQGKELGFLGDPLFVKRGIEQVKKSTACVGIHHAALQPGTYEYQAIGVKRR